MSKYEFFLCLKTGIVGSLADKKVSDTDKNHFDLWYVPLNSIFKQKYPWQVHKDQLFDVLNPDDTYSGAEKRFIIVVPNDGVGLLSQIEDKQKDELNRLREEAELAKRQVGRLQAELKLASQQSSKIGAARKEALGKPLERERPTVVRDKWGRILSADNPLLDREEGWQ